MVNNIDSIESSNTKKVYSLDDKTFSYDDVISLFCELDTNDELKVGAVYFECHCEYPDKSGLNLAIENVASESLRIEIDEAAINAYYDLLDSPTAS